jgi:AAA+ superfamily predicted ATPase
MAVSESSLVESAQRDETSAAVVEAPYASSDEHLWEELRRVDLLIRAQTIRWRTTIASTKPEQLWGMVHVTDDEVDAYLQTSFVPPGYLPASLVATLKPYWHEAHELHHKIRERVAGTPVETTLRLERLTSRCGLSNLERNILLLCLLPEVDGRYRRLLGYLQDDVSRTNPTVELLLQILSPVMSKLETGRSCFASDSRLIKQHLLVLIGDDALPMRSARLDPHVADYLLGTENLDARVAAVSFPVGPVSWSELILEPELLGRLQAFTSWWQQLAVPAGATLFLHGPTGAGRLRAAQAICATAGSPLLVVNAIKAVRAAHSLEELIDLVYREANLRGSSIYWSNCEVLLDASMPPQFWEYLIDASRNFKALVFLESTAHWEPAGEFHEHVYQRLDFQPPAYNMRRRLWETHLPGEAEFLDPVQDRAALAEQLSNGFQLTRGQILSVLDTARELAFQRNPRHPLIAVNDLYEGCRRQSYRQLVTFARRIEPRTELTFADLVMPEPNRRQLLELRERIRHRSEVYTGLGFERRLSLGKGLIALFTGSSGTGKTMAAELLAREQGVDLYKVDLSAVVSKYVGETEKNLSRVFAEAEDANAIIFFDEADALFGKRGEVKEAQDRWANMEVNYLLQRVEEYAGVVILASNLRQNIDEAFMRRIHVIAEFPFPEAGARLRILRGLFPKGLGHPTDDELQLVSDRFKFSGGSLKNIVLDAAFRALAEDGHQQQPNLTLRHLVLGAAREYQKLGKPLTRSDFGEDFFKWVEEIL